MDTRGPYAIEASNKERVRHLREDIKYFQHKQGALNLLHENQKYLASRGTPPERDRARVEKNRLLKRLEAIDERLRRIRNELKGYKTIKHLDPNSIEFEQEYQTFLAQEPQQASPGSEN